MKYIIGIDEAGRGPLAGPVAVGAVMVPIDFDWSLVVGAKDSKQMTEKTREKLFETMLVLQTEGKLDFSVEFSSAKMIDDIGIVPSIQSALCRALSRLVKAGPLHVSGLADVQVLLDGGLRAPKEFLNQTTIIRGDQSEISISLASIAAKVLRDRVMLELAPAYPDYAFEKHKGYGTLAHRTLIQKNGLSDIHRKSFCTRLHVDSNAV